MVVGCVNGHMSFLSRNAKHGVERPGQFIDDGDAALLGRAGKRVEIDHDDGFSHGDQRIASVPVFKGNEDDIALQNALSVAGRSWSFESWDLRIGCVAQNGDLQPKRQFSFVHVIENGFHAFWGAVEDVHFNRA